jgi:DNA-binding PadR family transcriptional regulator
MELEIPAGIDAIRHLAEPPSVSKGGAIMQRKKYTNGAVQIEGRELEGCRLSEVDDGPTGASAKLPDMAYVILGHVGMHPEGIHGYQLGRLLSRSAHRIPSLRLGQLYRVLRRLERAGLVDCHVESESSRLRYRFAISSRGNACLQKWLSHIPAGTGITCQQLLYRLRFAGRMPGTALLRLVDEAATECATNLEDLSRRGSSAREVAGPYEAALKARLATDRCWLEEVRRMLEKTVSESAKASAAL